MRRHLLLALALAVAATGLVACGNDDPDVAPVSTVAAGDKLTLTGGRTTISLDGITAGVLQDAEVSVAAAAPAKGSGTELSIPIIGGEITSGTLAGTIEHEGGIAFRAGNRRVTYSDLTIDTTAEQVYAGTGTRTPVFDLDMHGATSRNEGDQILIDGIVANLAAAAARELNAGLEVSAFVPAQRIGKLTIRATHGS